MPPLGAKTAAEVKRAADRAAIARMHKSLDIEIAQIPPTTNRTPDPVPARSLGAFLRRLVTWGRR
jgi:hypothetical protein